MREVKPAELAIVGLMVAGMVACRSHPDTRSSTTEQIPKFNDSYVELKAENFRTMIDGKNTDLFTIRNRRGMFAKITNLGAKFEQIVVPDRNGTFGDVILGYETIDAVVTGQPSMGAFIGRYANRIDGGVFTLDGTRYSVKVNEAAPRNNTLHGGARGGRYRVYDAKQLSDSVLQLDLTYRDAEDADPANGITGFPGTLAVQVVYSLNDTNELHIKYSARAVDRKTIVNLTGHSFFNLSNNPASTVLDHVIQVDADQVLESDNRLLPTGRLRDVSGTPMDFRVAKAFRQDYRTSYDLLNAVGGGGPGIAGGYDNHYALNKPTPGALSFAASAYEPTSGRKMEIWSTEPGIQVFTGQTLTGQRPRDVGKHTVIYKPYYGLVLEPSHFPDSANHPEFPSTILEANQTYEGEIIYKFSVVP